MGADLDGVQAAVIHLAAVMCAAGDGAFDGVVGGAGAPVVGTVGHSFFLQNYKLRHRAYGYFAPQEKNYAKKIFNGWEDTDCRGQFVHWPCNDIVFYKKCGG